MIYAYYMTQRPAMPGAQPGRGLCNVTDLTGTGLQINGKRVYSRIEYDRELTREEIRAYELTPENRPQPVEYKGYVIEYVDDSEGAWRIMLDGILIALVDTIEEAKQGIDSLLEE